MILKGSQRGGGRDLAVHLMKVTDNEHVRVHELRGFASDDLRSAFKEADAISRGTKCRQYLFSLSLNPPEGVSASVGDFADAIRRVEERLGLEGQPRAVVFHEKEGRRHAHCVWSRIDAQTMTARPMSFFKTKLTGLSRELYLEHGWKLPRGLETAGERDPTNFSLAEWQQAKRQGVDPRWLKQLVQDRWSRSDNLPAFTRALEERGLFIAKGDKRGIVLVDHTGDVHALPRVLGLKTKDVRERLGTGDALKSVAETQKDIGERMTPALRRHVQELRAQFQTRSAVLGQYKEEMTRLHREARLKLDERQTKEWRDGTRERAERMPKGLRGLWHRFTGQHRELQERNAREAEHQRARQADERQRLVEQQLEQRNVLQSEFKALRRAQAERLLELRQDIGRFLSFTRGESRAVEASRGVDLGLGLQR